jgi:hypothetical protein
LQASLDDDIGAYSEASGFDTKNLSITELITMCSTSSYSSLYNDNIQLDYYQDGWIILCDDNLAKYSL